MEDPFRGFRLPSPERRNLRLVEEEMEQSGTLNTTAPLLAAAILSRIGSSRISGVGDRKAGQRLRTVAVEYPPSRERAVQRIVKEYKERTLSVNLFGFVGGYKRVAGTLKRYGGTRSTTISVSGDSDL